MATILTPESRSSELLIVDTNSTKAYTRGEITEYTLDRRLPKNTNQIIIEIDRQTSTKTGIYTGFMYMNFFYSEDGVKWVEMDGGGCFGGVVTETEKNEEDLQRVREVPFTSASVGSIERYRGNYFKLRITSKDPQILPVPRILIGLG